MQTNRGFTLIEMIISLFILSLLLLGMDAMRLTALREAKTAYYFSTAREQLQFMQDILSVLQGRPYARPFAKWNEANRQLLPQGHGQLSGDYPAYSLSIFWGDNTQQICDHNQIGQSGCLHVTFQISKD